MFWSCPFFPLWFLLVTVFFFLGAGWELLNKSSLLRTRGPPTGSPFPLLNSWIRRPWNPGLGFPIGSSCFHLSMCQDVGWTTRQFGEVPGVVVLEKWWLLNRPDLLRSRNHLGVVLRIDSFFSYVFPHVFEVALYRLYCNTSHVEFVWELNSNFTWILQKIVMDSGYNKSQWKEWNNVYNSLWWLIWFYHSSTQGGHSFIHREWAFVPRHVLGLQLS